MTRRFAITFDYLCPFARNANEHVLAGIAGGADWDVSFVPYSLAQGHVEEGDTDVWDREDPHRSSGILALQAGIAVRDEHPEAFPAVHRGLFEARHDEGRDIKDPAVVGDVLAAHGVDAGSLLDEIAAGSWLPTLRKEHDAAVQEHQVWGVPTFITDERAVFVRVMDRPDGDTDTARRRVDHIVDLVDDVAELHEFKQVDLPR